MSPVSALGIVWFTIWVCSLSTLLILPGGVALGWLLGQTIAAVVFGVLKDLDKRMKN